MKINLGEIVSAAKAEIARYRKIVELKVEIKTLERINREQLKYEEQKRLEGPSEFAMRNMDKRRSEIESLELRIREMYGMQRDEIMLEDEEERDK